MSVLLASLDSILTGKFVLQVRNLRVRIIDNLIHLGAQRAVLISQGLREVLLIDAAIL